MIADDASGESAFLDIAANTLAIIMIMTMLSLLVTERQMRSTADPDAVVDPPLHFRLGERPVFSPMTYYLVVVDDRLLAIDMDRIVEAVVESGGGAVMDLQVDQGRVTFIPDQVGGYDLNVFQLQFAPDAEHLTMLPALDAGEFAALAETLRRRYREEGAAPSIAVYPSGMNLFAELHEVLVELDLPWRWAMVREGQPLRITRSPDGFRSFSVYW